MNTRYQTIDQKSWARASTFAGFLTYDFPYSVLGCELEIGAAKDYWKKQGLSPYRCMIYALLKAANEIPAFRQRIRDDQAIEFERVHANFTESLDEDHFAIRTQSFDPDFKIFYKSILPGAPGLESTHAGVTKKLQDHFIYLSCVPNVSFTHLVQATDRRSGSIPRLAWGKWFERDGKLLLPLSVQTHHSLVDGKHKAAFIEKLQASLLDPETHFSFERE